MSLLFAPILFGGLIYYARNGHGGRGTYLAVAFGSFLLGYVYNALFSGPYPSEMSAESVRAMRDFSDLASNFIFSLSIGGTLGGLFGAALFRSPESMQPTALCPHCAETILKAAKICKHCGRDATQPA